MAREGIDNFQGRPAGVQIYAVHGFDLFEHLFDVRGLRVGLDEGNLCICDRAGCEAGQLRCGVGAVLGLHLLRTALRLRHPGTPRVLSLERHVHRLSQGQDTLDRLERSHERRAFGFGGVELLPHQRKLRFVSVAFGAELLGLRLGRRHHLLAHAPRLF